MAALSSRAAFFLTAALLILAYFNCRYSHAATLRHTITITNATLTDVECSGIASMLPLVNGTLPGPTITANVGDTLEVTVRNAIPHHGLAMHWHGIRQLGTPWSDGVPWVTQAPISPNASRFYRMLLSEPGTFFYHAHDSHSHAATVYGAIVVQNIGDGAMLGYDDERVLVLGDWWRRAAHQRPGASAAVPDAIVVNGKKCASNPAAVPLRRGITTRVRIVHAGNRVPFRLAFPADLRARIVEADGGMVQEHPIKAAAGLDVAPGQRYSVLVSVPSDSTALSDSVVVGIDGHPDAPVTTAVLKYIDTNADPMTVVTSPLAGESATSDVAVLAAIQSAIAKPYAERPQVKTSLRALNPTINPPPADASRTLILIVDSAPGASRSTINNATFMPPAGTAHKLPPMLHSAYQGRATEDILSVPGVYVFQLGEVVDVVVQQASGLCRESHSWHLHGHSFHVMAQGVGNYSFDAYMATLANASIPMAEILPQDTTASQHPTNASTQGDGCGWMVLRVKFDNPGIWLFHSHFAGVLFAVGLDALKAQAASLPDEVKRVVLDPGTGAVGADGTGSKQVGVPLAKGSGGAGRKGAGAAVALSLLSMVAVLIAH